MNGLTMFTVVLLVLWMILSTLVIYRLTQKVRKLYAQLNDYLESCEIRCDRNWATGRDNHEDVRFLTLTLQRYFPNFIGVVQGVKFLDKPVSYDEFKSGAQDATIKAITEEVKRLVKDDKECHNGFENVGK